MYVLATASLVLWLIIFMLPWKPWLVREQWDAGKVEDLPYIGNVTVVIPARNEEQVIHQTVSAVLGQGREISVVVIDDESTDTTYQCVSKFGSKVTLLKGATRPEGWSGKLWALEQGRKYANTPLVLLLDADIEMKPGFIIGLQRFLIDQGKDMVSLMAGPPLYSFWERLLLPAFVYYFKLLYPFSMANSSSNYIAAAAGGCILIKKEALDEIGGFSGIRGALIDDCRLARQIKKAGFHTWLGLTHSITSIRPYRGLSEIWDMVARTAYTQLNHSILLLFLCTAVMLLAYLVPVLALGSTNTIAVLGAVTLLVMHVTYMPVLSYYKQSWLWAPTMPLIASLYLGMTWTSAFRYWHGERFRWRGRVIRTKTRYHGSKIK